MPTSSPSPKTLNEVIEIFSTTNQVEKNPKLIKNLKTVLKKCILPSFGFSEFKQNQYMTVDDFCDKVTVYQLGEIEKTFEKFYSLALEQNISRGTLHNYRSILFRFLKWMYQQDWYCEVAGTNEGKFAPRINASYSLMQARRGNRAYAAKPYALKEAELTLKLSEQMKKLHRFLTAPEIPKRKDPPIRESSWLSYRASILACLGWLYRTEKWTLDNLDLTLVGKLDILEEFLAWGINERGNGYAWAQTIALTSLNVAKWEYHQVSKKPKYCDIEEIEQLRNKLNEISHKYQKSPRLKDLEACLITFEQCQQVVQHLRRCTAPRSASGGWRSELTIMQSWQRYLIISILTYCPVRQREIRELEIGRTLFRETSEYVVKLAPEDHKTGSKTGNSREFALPELLTADLDLWIAEWRPKIPTNHNLVFFRLAAKDTHVNGQPWEKSVFSRMVTGTMFRATGHLFGEPKKTRPHDFRRIAITWQRKYGRRDQDRALAEVMGHSVDQADRTYSQLTSRDFTEQSKDWWKSR